MGNTDSGDPLVIMMCSCPSCTTTLMRLRMKSNGISSIFFTFVIPCAPISASCWSTAESMGFFSPVWKCEFMKARRSTRSSSTMSMFTWRTSSILSSVSVPVLSVHSTSIAPRFWMDGRRLTIASFFAMFLAPWDRLAVTMTGSISGARPTATASEKRIAATTSLFVTEFIRKIANTRTITNLTMRLLYSRMPRSNAVSGADIASLRASSPNCVSSPVRTTMASAEPETTLLPKKTAFSIFCTGEPGGDGAGDFSTGNDSPVSDAWFTKKSLQVIILQSAGTKSPADKRTMSPGTRNLRGTSRAAPSRTTVAVFRIILRSFSASSRAVYSW